ncbi:transaldolase family protein, partial [Catenibacterium mitsuokai]|uniref:transaldolase family protein n=1 Tax=Catenibacterium mitsuokai TaxID=100886 RepID=UPI003F938B2A
MYYLKQLRMILSVELNRVYRRRKTMEFIIDTVDLEEIRDAVDHLPIVGVTSNPSIVKKTSPKDFFGHM